MARSEDKQITQRDVFEKYFKDSLVEDLFKMSWNGSNINVVCTPKADIMFEELKSNFGVTENDIELYIKGVIARLIYDHTKERDEFRNNN